MLQLDATYYQMKPSLLPRGFKKSSELQSIDIRKRLGLSATIACPARKVAALYGVTVTPVQTLCSLVEDTLSDLFPDTYITTQCISRLTESDGGFSAIVAIVGQYKMILYNSHHSPARQESDIMHELAHIICKHPGDCLQLNSDIGLRQFHTQHEEEAKWLGATLQIPDQGLFTLALQGLSNEEIAEIYGSSLEMVVFRRRTLGIDVRISRRNKFVRDMFNEVCHFLNSGVTSDALPEHNRELL